MTARFRHALTIPLTAFGLLTTSSARAEVSIRLSELPGRLILPMQDGTNQILTATVRGNGVVSVKLVVEGTELGSTGVPLTPVGDGGEYRLNLASREVYEFLSNHGSAGEFRIHAQTADGRSGESITVRYAVRAVPKRLDFPWNEATFTIYQRSCKLIPGSLDTLRLCFGDITIGEVLVSVMGPFGDYVVETTPLRAGEHVKLPLAEEQYVLRIEKLVNLLVGMDYGVVALMPVDQYETYRIDRALQMIADSELRFIRNDKDMPGHSFAAHLRGKHEFCQPAAKSLDQFLDTIAARSVATGETYRVKLASGEIVELAPWLRARMTDTRSRPKGALLDGS